MTRLFQSKSRGLIERFVSVPRDMGGFNAGSFVAGIIEGVLEAGGFKARVVAHSTGDEVHRGKTTYLIKFDAEVMERERKKKGF
jgi:hypothetical protein